MRNIETDLESRIKHVFDELENEPIGTERYEELTKEYQKLLEMYDKMVKTKVEKDKAFDSRELEWEKLKFEKKKEESNKRRGFRETIVHVGTTAASIGSSFFLAKKIMKFEEQGVLTSKSWRTCFDKIRWW